MKNPKKNIQINKSQKGFSLLEMIVAIGIFGAIVTLSVNIVVIAGAAQVKASLLRAVQDNIRFAIQFMNKEVRTSHALTSHHADGTLCSSGTLCDQIRFINDRGDTIAYCVLDNVLIRSKAQGGVGGDCTDPGTNIHLTSDDVQVNSVQFYVVGDQVGPADGQPMITMIMDFEAKTSKQKDITAMHLQTTVTQRFRDINQN